MEQNVIQNKQDIFNKRYEESNFKFHWTMLNFQFYNFFLFFFFWFLGLHLWHMEVFMLGVELKLQPWAYTTATAMRDLSRVCISYLISIIVGGR